MAEQVQITSKWRAYPEYRDSGIHSLGQIPAHWDVWKASHAFGYIGSGTTPNTSDLRFYDGDVPWVTTSELREGYISDTTTKLTQLALDSHSALKLYRPGTLLMAMYGATIGRLGILSIEACTNQACCAFADPRELDARFAFYCLLSFRKEIINLSSGGGQPNINQNLIRSLKICTPPLNEQSTIAHFLDHQTAKLDSLVHKKQWLIRLLLEKRKTLVQTAVTQGIDPVVPKRDSNVDWIGEIPAHWKVTRLKFVVGRIGSGKTPKGGSEVYINAGTMFLRSQNVHFDGLRLDDVAYIDEQTDSEMSGTRVLPGDVLLNITGASLGRCSIVPEGLGPANVNQHVCIVRPTQEKINSTFLCNVLASNAIQTQIFAGENGTSREGLTFDQIANFVFAMPDNLAEQKQITTHIESITSKLDFLIQKLTEHIAKVKEYRTALIAAAVTGHIDVRGYSDQN